jgi:hypothetical protein
LSSLALGSTQRPRRGAQHGSKRRDSAGGWRELLLLLLLLLLCDCHGVRLHGACRDELGSSIDRERQLLRDGHGARLHGCRDEPSTESDSWYSRPCAATCCPLASPACACTAASAASAASAVATTPSTASTAAMPTMLAAR